MKLFIILPVFLFVLTNPKICCLSLYEQARQETQSLFNSIDDEPQPEELNIENEQYQTDTLPSNESLPEGNETNPDSVSIEELINSIYNQAKSDEQNTQNDEFYYKIFKSSELFSAFLRELLKNYVIPLDPEQLIFNAIEGITSQLDPYTLFFSSKEELEKVLSNPPYVGLGIVANIYDSSIVVTNFVDSTAQEITGLKIGDIIIGIDSVILPPNLDTLKKYTSGKENTPIQIIVKREGIDSLITIITYRRSIELPYVSSFKILDVDNGKICFVRLEGFTEDAIEKIKTRMQEFVQLPSQQKKGIIIDLRDNPGGTLESAIQFCEMFLPSGSVVVTVKMQERYDSTQYRATFAPIDTITPLVILVNKGSASASEVVAGAIQDNDRGVIVGEQTYGKGLVQSVITLPYNTFLKITTSKYFTPSGRCINRNHFDNETNNKINQLHHTESIFFTKNHRKVVESNGIQPDIVVKNDSESALVQFLRMKNLFTFFVAYLENTGQLKNGPPPDEKLLKLFANYLKNKRLEYKTPFEILLDTLINIAKSSPENKTLSNKLIQIKKETKKPVERLILDNKQKILEILYKEISLRNESFENRKTKVVQSDPYFQTAIRILLDSKNYNKILGKNF